MGFTDCEAIARVGQRNMEPTTRHRNKNLPHTCCMYLLPFLFTAGAVEACVSYCFFSTIILFLHMETENCVSFWVSCVEIA